MYPFCPASTFEAPRARVLLFIPPLPASARIAPLRPEARDAPEALYTTPPARACPAGPLVQCCRMCPIVAIPRVCPINIHTAAYLSASARQVIFMVFRGCTPGAPPPVELTYDWRTARLTLNHGSGWRCRGSRPSESFRLQNRRQLCASADGRHKARAYLLCVLRSFRRAPHLPSRADCSSHGHANYQQVLLLARMLSVVSDRW